MRETHLFRFTIQTIMSRLATTIRSLYVVHPVLIDVWTNHLLAFLFPSVIQVRKRMTIMLYEMMCRINTSSTHAPYLSLFLLRLELKYRSFWLDPNRAVVSEPVLGYRTKPFYYHILHLSDNGLIHCTTTMSRDGTDRLSIKCEDKLLCMNGSMVWYYKRREDQERRWMRVDDEESAEITCVCMRRPFVVEWIRNRQHRLLTHALHSES
jgi:hypothetical protein